MGNFGRGKRGVSRGGGWGGSVGMRAILVLG